MIEPAHLEKDELDYELSIRGIENIMDRRTGTKELRRLLKLERNGTSPYSTLPDLNAQTELWPLEAKFRGLVVAYENAKARDQQADYLKIVNSRLVHLWARAGRLSGTEPGQVKRIESLQTDISLTLATVSVSNSLLDEAQARTGAISKKITIEDIGEEIQTDGGEAASLENFANLDIHELAMPINHGIHLQQVATITSVEKSSNNRHTKSNPNYRLEYNQGTTHLETTPSQQGHNRELFPNKSNRNSTHFVDQDPNMGNQKITNPNHSKPNKEFNQNKSDIRPISKQNPFRTQPKVNRQNSNATTRQSNLDGDTPNRVNTTMQPRAVQFTKQPNPYHDPPNYNSHSNQNIAQDLNSIYPPQTNQFSKRPNNNTYTHHTNQFQHQNHNQIKNERGNTYNTHPDYIYPSSNNSNPYSFEHRSTAAGPNFLQNMSNQNHQPRISVNTGTQNNTENDRASRFNMRRLNPVTAWNLTFSGDDTTSLNDFLSQISLFARAERVSDDELLTSAIYLLTGSARMWYRAFHTHFHSWDELVEALRYQFLPNDYDFWLMREIEQRRQGEDESFGIFLASMEMLFRNLSYQVPENQKIDIIMRNMLPCYEDRLVMDDISSIYELATKVKRLERTRFRRSRQWANIPQENLLEPAFSNPFQYRRNEMCALSSSVGPSNEMSCFNCHQKGHHHRNCTVKREHEIFCYRCGTPGYKLADCENCNPGNVNAGPKQGVERTPCQTIQQTPMKKDASTSMK